MTPRAERELDGEGESAGYDHDHGHSRHGVAVSHAEETPSRVRVGHGNGRTRIASDDHGSDGGRDGALTQSQARQSQYKRVGTRSADPVGEFAARAGSSARKVGSGLKNPGAKSRSDAAAVAGAGGESTDKRAQNGYAQADVSAFAAAVAGDGASTGGGGRFDLHDQTGAGDPTVEEQTQGDPFAIDPYAMTNPYAVDARDQGDDAHAAEREDPSPAPSSPSAKEKKEKKEKKKKKKRPKFEWTEHEDEASGLFYYHSRISKVTTWEKPGDFPGKPIEPKPS